MATKKAIVPKRSAKTTATGKAQALSSVSLPPIVVTSMVAKSKMTSLKKTATKKAVAKKVSKKPEVIVVEEITLAPNESLKLPSNATTEYVVVHRCTNCEHIPFSLTRLITLFSIIIMLLSVSVLIQVGTIDISKLIAFVSPVALAASNIFPR